MRYPTSAGAGTGESSDVKSQSVARFAGLKWAIKNLLVAVAAFD
jgi:hypothetical protein